MNINWKTFITKDYWLGIDRVTVHLTDKIVLYVGAGLLLLGVIFLIIKLISSDKLKKPHFRSISSILITTGLLEMLWYVLRWQYVSVLGARLTALLIGLVGLICLWKPISYFVFKYRSDVNLLSKEELKDKYLHMNR